MIKRRCADFELSAIGFFGFRVHAQIDLYNRFQINGFCNQFRHLYRLHLSTIGFFGFQISILGELKNSIDMPSNPPSENQGDAILVEVQEEKRSIQGGAIIPVSSLHDNPNDRIKWWPIYYEDNKCIGKVQLSIRITIASDETTQGVLIVYDYELNIGWGKSISLTAPPPGQMTIRSPSGPPVTSVPSQNSELVVYPSHMQQDGRFSTLKNVSELAKVLVKLKLVFSVATATVERCFSEMKLVKTDLRNRIGDEFLNDCSIVHPLDFEARSATAGNSSHRFLKVPKHRQNQEGVKTYRNGGDNSRRKQRRKTATVSGGCLCSPAVRVHSGRSVRGKTDGTAVKQSTHDVCCSPEGRCGEEGRRKRWIIKVTSSNSNSFMKAELDIGGLTLGGLIRRKWSKAVNGGLGGH
ncbi:hypothetical protein LXL04_006460 [Taraxacum kok-saghyz]